MSLLRFSQCFFSSLFWILFFFVHIHSPRSEDLVTENLNALSNETRSFSASEYVLMNVWLSCWKSSPRLRHSITVGATSDLSTYPWNTKSTTATATATEKKQNTLEFIERKQSCTYENEKKKYLLGLPEVTALKIQFMTPNSCKLLPLSRKAYIVNWLRYLPSALKITRWSERVRGREKERRKDRERVTVCRKIYIFLCKQGTESNTHNFYWFLFRSKSHTHTSAEAQIMRNFKWML